MTTDRTAGPQQAPSRRRSTGRPALLRAALVGAGVSLALVLVAAVVDSGRGAGGAALGAGVTLAVFLLGAYAVDLVATAVPAAALGAALMTYTLQVALLGLFFLVMNGSGLLDDALSRTWLGLGVMVVCVTWVAAQSVAVLRQRIPTYDLDEEAGA